jgi:hypothetical protein
MKPLLFHGTIIQNNKQMTDTNFERRAELLTNDGYFGRVRELCQTLSVEDAWRTVESELPFGLRRFTHITSFKAARHKEANGTLSKPEFKATL